MLPIMAHFLVFAHSCRQANPQQSLALGNRFTGVVSLRVTHRASRIATIVIVWSTWAPTNFVSARLSQRQSRLAVGATITPPNMREFSEANGDTQKWSTNIFLSSLHARPIGVAPA
jgi:hypothetical protein